MKTFFFIVLIYCDLLTSRFVLTYSKVSRNGQARSKTQDIAFTVSPIYVSTPRTVDLLPGEVINHPSTSKYSTLDEEMLAKLNDRTRAQHRFHPPASFEHVLAHTNALRQQSVNSDLNLIRPSSNNDVIYSKPVVSMTYDYPPDFDANSKAMAKPSPPSDSFPVYSSPKIPDSYSPGPNSDSPPREISDYDNKPPSFDFDHPPKSVEFPSHFDRPFEDTPPYPHEPYHHEEIIYDDDHHFHHHHHHRPHPSTTEEPEMMDQRLNKRPYSYYFIGKKLWYIPLYFSIYFIIYIAALVLKSIARHKINFPSNLAAVAAADHGRSANVDDGNSPGWMDYVVKVLDAIEKYGNMT